VNATVGTETMKECGIAAAIVFLVISALLAVWFDAGWAVSWHAGFYLFTVRQFESQVCDHMVAIHHAHKRTDIQRNDKNQRGYARVSLQDAADFTPSPAPAQQDLVPF
jgi:hypothetical protein